jgi:monoamine oxidase
MAEGLQVKYGQIVTGIRPRSTKIQVSVAGCTQPYQFQHVITTIAIPALRILDLDDCELGFEQRAAMRQLQVESSVKIGIQFTDAWWTNDLGIKGGFSFTDRSIRLVVYPSDDSTVLIACYTRPRDSLVLQSLIGSGDVADKRLKALVLRDISAVHDVPIEYLESKYKTHFAFDWGHDPFAHGMMMISFTCTS